MTRPPDRSSILLGPRAHGDLRHERTPHGERVACGGLLVEDGPTVLMASPSCGPRLLDSDELCIAQRHRPGSVAAERICCIPCAIAAQAIDNATIQWAVAAWVDSRNASRFIRNSLAVTNAAVVDHLVHSTLDRASGVVARGGTITLVGPWCKQVMRRELACLKRTSPRRQQRVRFELNADQVAHDEPSLVTFSTDDVRDELVGLDMEPWERSAALTMVAIQVDRAEPGEQCPKPGQGAAATSRTDWAALWYAGRRNVFVAQDGESETAVRQRRARMIKTFRAKLSTAAVRAFGGPDE